MFFKDNSSVNVGHLLISRAGAVLGAAIRGQPRRRRTAWAGPPAAMHDGRSHGGVRSCGDSCFAPGSSGVSVMAKRTDVGLCVPVAR